MTKRVLHPIAGSDTKEKQNVSPVPSFPAKALQQIEVELFLVACNREGSCSQHVARRLLAEPADQLAARWRR